MDVSFTDWPMTATKLDNRRPRLKEKRTKPRKQREKQRNTTRQQLQTLAPNAKEVLMTEEPKTGLRGALAGIDVLGRDLVAGTTAAAVGAIVVAVATTAGVATAVTAMATVDAEVTETPDVNETGAGTGAATIPRPRTGTAP